MSAADTIPYPAEVCAKAACDFTELEGITCTIVELLGTTGIVARAPPITERTEIAEELLIFVDFSFLFDCAFDISQITPIEILGLLQITTG